MSFTTTRLTKVFQVRARELTRKSAVVKLFSNITVHSVDRNLQAWRVLNLSIVLYHHHIKEVMSHAHYLIVA